MSVLDVPPLVWLNAGATSASSDAAKTEAAKLTYLKVGERTASTSARSRPSVVTRFCSLRSPLLPMPNTSSGNRRERPPFPGTWPRASRRQPRAVWLAAGAA